MEISVGFADKAEEYYMERGYIWEKSMLGRVYYPADGVKLCGRAAIRYMEYPWISTFETDGIRAVTENNEKGDKVDGTELW